MTTSPDGSKDPARRAAADVLLAVDTEGAYGNLLLPRVLRECGLTGTDAAFATELCYGALRRSGVLDAVIGDGARRPAETLDPPVRAALRLGAYQLLHTRVPPHAAVSATVDVSREIAGHKTAGLVNAVLRRVGDRDWAGWVERLAPADDPLGRLAFDCGYPEWIAGALLEALDGDLAELAALLREERPVTHLVARPGLIARDELLAECGPGASAGRFSPYAVELAGGDPADLASVRDGRAAVQDEGSQLVALALAAAELAGRDQNWLDTCAGPGGKAALLAGLRPAGARLVAGEPQPHRARLVAGAVERYADVHVVIADGTVPPWRGGGYDRVLVDAPCTGLGALRRRPEARWRRQPGDVEELHLLQCALLAGAIDSLRPGGVVAYATCSPHRRETVDVVESVVGGRRDCEVMDGSRALPGLPQPGRTPYIQMWPQRHGTDAMFVALVRRTDHPKRLMTDSEKS